MPDKTRQNFTHADVATLVGAFSAGGLEAVRKAYASDESFARAREKLFDLGMIALDEHGARIIQNFLTQVESLKTEEQRLLAVRIAIKRLRALLPGKAAKE